MSPGVHDLVHGARSAILECRYCGCKQFTSSTPGPPGVATSAAAGVPPLRQADDHLEITGLSSLRKTRVFTLDAVFLIVMATLCLTFPLHGYNTARKGYPLDSGRPNR